LRSFSMTLHVNLIDIFNRSLCRIHCQQQHVHIMPSRFPEIQGGGSLILAWQIKNKNVIVIGGGEVSRVPIHKMKILTFIIRLPLAALSTYSMPTPKLQWYVLLAD
jgi:hypothetical protein